MDVERGARQCRDGEEWVERLERHLVQLSINPTITLASSSSLPIEKVDETAHSNHYEKGGKA